MTHQYLSSDVLIQAFFKRYNILIFCQQVNGPVHRQFASTQGGLTCWNSFHRAHSVLTNSALQENLTKSPAQERAKPRPFSVLSRNQELYLPQFRPQASTAVPRIIHQSWRSKKLESFQKEWQKSWLTNHPDWTYMFWTDKDNRRLIADHFPWFLDVYDSFPLNIQRADCARYFYMLQFGGCYFDLDFESLKSLDPLLLDVQVALAYMTKDTASDISIPNAFVASVPGHAFWWYVLKHVFTAVASDTIGDGDAHRTTGPIMLKNAVAQYHSASPVQDLTIFPSEVIIGVDYSWRDDPQMLSTFSRCHAPSKEFQLHGMQADVPRLVFNNILVWRFDLDG